MRTLIRTVVVGVVAGLTVAPTTCMAGVVSSAPSVAPTIFAMSLHIGWEVDAVTGRNTCVAVSEHTCSSHKQSQEAGGFDYPSSVAVDPRKGNIYVADLSNFRVQKFTADGTFVLTFGGDVNATTDAQRGASPEMRNICTARSSDRCTAGTSGGEAGQLSYPASVAVDPHTGDVYIMEVGAGHNRLDKYTPDGRFVWTVSRGFKSASQSGDLLAVGGPEHLVYVGDEHRVREFDVQGRLRREILLASASAAPLSAVSSIAVDRAGDVYLVYRTSTQERGAPVEHADLIRRFNPAGEEVGQFPVLARLPNAEAHIDGIALDPTGRLAVIGVEEGPVIGAEAGPGFYERFGFVYEGATGRLVGEFPPPQDNDGLTFDGRGGLYVAATDDQEVVGYAPLAAAGLLTSVVGCGFDGRAGGISKPTGCLTY
jgi:sugar lactone lactonase YvrE